VDPIREFIRLLLILQKPWYIFRDWKTDPDIWMGKHIKHFLLV